MVVGPGGILNRANAAQVCREQLLKPLGGSAMFTYFRMRTRVLLGGSVLALCLMMVSSGQAQQARMADSGLPASAVAVDDLGPGCASERPAVAHHQGGAIVKTSEP